MEGKGRVAVPRKWKMTSARRPDGRWREAGKGAFVGLKVAARSGEGKKMLFNVVQSRDVHENKENKDNSSAIGNDIVSYYGTKNPNVAEVGELSATFGAVGAVRARQNVGTSEQAGGFRQGTRRCRRPATPYGLACAAPVQHRRHNMRRRFCQGFDSFSAKKARIALYNAAGCSSQEKCPQRSRRTRRDFFRAR